jgi:hypothetical protein
MSKVVLFQVLSKVLYIGLLFPLKTVIIRFDDHAEFRLAERSERFGIPVEESRRRALTAIRTGQEQRQGTKVTYCRYFHDNLTYRVIVKERRHGKERRIVIKTIIITRGRL